MATNRFSIGDAVRFGWDAMKNNLAFFVVIVLIAWVVEGVPSGLQSIFYDTWALVIVLSLISAVIGVFVHMAYVRISLLFAGGEVADYPDLYLSYPLFWKFLGGSILYGLIVLGGLILLIVPGIIFAVKYQFFAYLIIDQGAGPVESIKRSGEITMGAKWDVFVLDLAFLGINLLGFLACFVGLFATIPTTMVAMAYVYRRLLATPVVGLHIEDQGSVAAPADEPPVEPQP